MKKFAVFIIALALVMGCIGGDEDTTETTKPETPPQPETTTPPPTTTSVPTTTTAAPTTTASPTTSAPSALLGELFTPIFRDGMWAKYTLISNGQEIVVTMKMFDDGDTYALEYDTNMETMTATAQVWIKKTGDSLWQGEQVKYIIEMGNNVYCLDASTFTRYAGESGAEEYAPTKYEEHPVVRKDTYTTLTGKKLDVFVVEDDNNEYWFSSEAPFSIVKVVTEGKVTMSLDDFGFDAKRTISKEEGENCIPMETPPSTP